MLKSLLTAFLGCVLLLSSSTIYAQYNEDLLSQNNKLLNLTEEVIHDVETAFFDKKIDTAFRNAMMGQLKKIHTMAIQRRQFLYEARGVNNSATSAIFRQKTIKQTNRRMVAEWINFEKEMMFCNASKRIITMSSQFTDTKKVYFAEDVFLIPRKYQSQAKQTYSAIMDSIISLSNAYPKIDFNATILTIGYADQASHSKGSSLYNNMVYRIGKEPLTNIEINDYVSYLRAYDLASILRDYVKERITNPKNVTINITQEGKGTTLPDNATEYNMIDENRRIVKVRWHILPKF